MQVKFYLILLLAGLSIIRTLEGNVAILVYRKRVELAQEQFCLISSRENLLNFQKAIAEQKAFITGLQTYKHLLISGLRPIGSKIRKSIIEVLEAVEFSEIYGSRELEKIADYIMLSILTSYNMVASCTIWSEKEGLRIVDLIDKEPQEVPLGKPSKNIAWRFF